MENKHPSIMIVDDNETDRYLLKRDLSSIDYKGEIFEAEDGQEALDFLIDYDEKQKKFGKRYPPIYIFLDVNMPIMNGLEFLEKFAGLKDDDDRYTSIVVLMYTSSGQDADIRRSSSFDFVAEYMVKGSYNLDMLRNMLITD